MYSAIPLSLVLMRDMAVIVNSRPSNAYSGQLLKILALLEWYILSQQKLVARGLLEMRAGATLRHTLKNNHDFQR